MTAPGFIVDAESLGRRLQSIADKTSSAADMLPPGFWGGDSAAERRIYDDIKAGREYFRRAHRSAVRGLEALRDGDLETAGLHWTVASDFYVAALESRVGPSDVADLSTNAKQRGRSRAKGDRDRRLSEAIARQVASGLKGQAAVNAALAADPNLAAEVRDMSSDAIRKAVARYSGE